LCCGLFVRRGLGLPILGYDISPAERVLNGEVPYRDFLYNYTPGVLWLNAALMKLFGVSLLTVNFALFAFKLGALIVLFVIARRLTCPWQAVIVVVISLAWIGYRVVFRAYPTQYSMVFVLLGLWSMLRYNLTDRARWLVVCGASLGVVFLFKQNVGVYLVVLSTAALAVREIAAAPSGSGVIGRMVARASGLWASFALVSSTAFVYAASNGALGAMMSHFTSLGAEYGDKRAVPLPSLKSLSPAAVALVVLIGVGVFVSRAAPRVLGPLAVVTLLVISAAILYPGRAYQIKNSATAVIAYLGPALFLLTAVVLLWGFRRDARNAWWLDRGPILLTGVFALGTYLEAYPRADYAHVVRVLPPVFLLMMVLAARGASSLRTHLATRLQNPSRAALLCAAVPLVLVVVIGIKDVWQPRFDGRLRFHERTPLTLARARGIMVTHKQAEFIETLADEIEAKTAADDSMFSFPAKGTAFYFLTGRRNPTRFTWWRSAGLKMSEKESWLNQISAGTPKLLLVSAGMKDQRVLQSVNNAFSQVSTVGNIEIFVRKEAPQALSHN